MEETKLDEPPSIIQEIVIYNKPNVNAVVPNEILPTSRELSLGRGDIVISRVRNSLQAKPSNIEYEIAISEGSESDQESNDSSIISSTKEIDISIEETEISIKEEDESECLVENDLELIETEQENIMLFYEVPDGPPIVAKELVQKTPKVVKELKNILDLDESISEKNVQITKNNVTTNDTETNTFKRPRGRPRKSISTPQKSTLNSFVIVTTSTKNDASNGKNVGSSSDKNESVKSYTPSGKRPRGRPKRVNKGISEEDELSDKNSTDDEVTPSKRRRNNNVVRTYTRKNTLRGMSGTAKKQIDAVEEELQSMFEEEHGHQQEESNTIKGNKKSSKKTPAEPKGSKKIGNRKKSQLLDKTIKTECIPSADPSESPFDEDDDSRTEWMPDDYVQYKQKHIIKNSKKSVHQCKYCGQDFSSYYGMRKHRALEHDDLVKDRKEALYGGSNGNEAEEAKDEGDSDEETRGEWMPQDYAEYKLKCNRDKMKRTQWYKCKICCSVFSNYYKLSKHKTEHQNKATPYDCKFCEASFGNIETLMAHLREHQGKDPYQCKKCEKGFKTKEELDEHMTVHLLKKGPTPVKRFRCDVCGKEFSKLCDIERHTRVHTGEKSCECKICHKRFQQSHNLSKHLLIHLHVKPFQCAICNKKFGRIDVLNRHLLTHSMEKPFKCGVCNKGFIREVQLKNHLNKHHPEEGETIELEEEDDDPGEAEERVIPNEEALSS